MKLFTLFMLFSAPLFGGVTDSGLKQISLNDKLRIRAFVEINLKWHQLAHVIYFDNKPMCLTSARLKSPDKQSMDVYWIKGWRAFKKNEHLFPHPNFIFNTEIDEDQEGWKSINLVIVNKRALVKCLNNHLCFFQEVLDEDFSCDWFISELERNKNIFTILKNDERLIGILLGYGKESASVFRNHQILNPDILLSDDANTYCPIDAQAPKGCKFFPIVIMGNPHSEEVQNLMSIYDKELEEFWSVYRNRDPLELFLKCICGES